MSALDNFDFLDTIGPLSVEDDSSLPMSRMSSPPIMNDYPSTFQSDLSLPSLTDLPELGEFLSLPTMTPKIPQFTQSIPLFPSQPTTQFPVFASVPTQLPSMKTEPVHHQLAPPQPPVKKSEPKKRRKSTTGKAVTPEDRASARRIKHRLIDRARRRRVKDSIDQLKDLVHFEAHEKPDKATVVSSAVREIQDLKTQVSQLQAQLNRMTVASSSSPLSTATSPSAFSLGEDSSPESPPRLDEKTLFSSIISEKVPVTFHLPTFLSGLGGAGVVSLIFGMDCRIRDVNGLFETITGFRREEVAGGRFMDAPLYGRNVHGKYPMRFVKSSDPSLALIPTASASDLACPDFKRAVSALQNGGTFKVVSRLLTRDGQILECLNTFFLLRNERQEPLALVGLSTPDCRRLINLNHRREEQVDIFVDPAHVSSPTDYPQIFRPFADDFLTPLTTQT